MLTLQEISDLLRDKWNPIGCEPDLPRDEFERYASKVLQLLETGFRREAATAQIASYLTWVRLQQIEAADLLGLGASSDATAAVIIVDAAYQKWSKGGWCD